MVLALRRRNSSAVTERCLLGFSASSSPPACLVPDDRGGLMAETSTSNSAGCVFASTPPQPSQW